MGSWKQGVGVGVGVGVNKAKREGRNVLYS